MTTLTTPDTLRQMKAKYKQDRTYIDSLQDLNPSASAFAEMVKQQLAELNTRMQQLIDVMGGEV